MYKNYQDSPKVIHGIEARHPFYACWYNMLKRCTDNSHPQWARYGGRGITVCPAWFDFAVFKTDMFPSWKPRLELERSDNNKGYSKENCVWATRAQQCQNTNRTKLSDAIVALMKERRALGWTVKQIAESAEISESHCSRVLRGLKWV
jgi:hypothetical protein